MFIQILVVDDSASDRLIIKNMLKEFNILTACNGVEAMKVLEEHDGINLLILDLNMPVMNGFEVLESLRGKERFRNLRTIILTNHDEVDNEIRGLQLGAVDYIRKPIHMESLKARIDVHVALLHARQILEQRLDEQTLTFNMLFTQAPIGIAISYNLSPQLANDATVKINPMLEKILGRTEKELMHLGWAEITHPDDVDKDIENFKKLQAGDIKSYSMEKRFEKPDGTFVWAYMVVAALALTDDNKFNHICLIQDISELKQIENKLRYVYEHDRLTGLYNRNYMNALLEHDAQQEKTSKRALIGIDLNTVRLLTVNYGFLYTQNLIKKAADALRRHCTETRLLFQTHETRFVFYLLDYRDKNELIDFSDVLANTLESLLVTDRIGGGIGILEIDQDEKELDIDLLQRRLSIASEKSIDIFGKDFGSCFYDKELEAMVNRERSIREALSAIAEEKATKDEFYVQYQPILDLRTGFIHSFEALSRLRTQKLGPVSPAEFIPIAEKTKLINPIGDKVLVSAFRFLNKLKEHGYGSIKVAINISAIQLLRPDFSSRLFEMISRMQVNPENVGIELTESMFASDYMKINRILEELKSSGLYIAIDDFGTGYSSLAREKELSFDCLKIDKYFIDKLTETDPSAAITSDIISISHKLGHYTIAEGVEFESQLQYLQGHDCDKIQGYLISKPLDEEAAIELLKNKNTDIASH